MQLSRPQEAPKQLHLGISNEETPLSRTREETAGSVPPKSGGTLQSKWKWGRDHPNFSSALQIFSLVFTSLLGSNPQKLNDRLNFNILIVPVRLMKIQTKIKFLANEMPSLFTHYSVMICLPHDSNLRTKPALSLTFLQAVFL